MIVSYNPSDGSVLHTYPITPRSHIDTALEHLSNGIGDWALTSIAKRKRLVLSIKRKLIQNKQSLAILIAKENGKPLPEALLEVEGSINKIEMSIEAYQTRQKTVEFTQQNKRFHVGYKPIGVCAVIGPFNFPVHLPLGHIIPALLAGNVVIFKPSEYTTGVGVFLSELLWQAGCPKSVFQLVIGKGKEGAYVVKHSLVNGVFFTGGYATGKRIASVVSAMPEKLLALEMGGNNPLVVSSYKQLDPLIDMIVRSAFLTTGQRCTCARRLILVRKKRNRPIVEALVRKVSQLTVGAYDEEPAPFMGPVISKQAKSTIMKQYRMMVDSGATDLLALQSPRSGGYFLRPGILDITNCASQLPDTECFGPLLLIQWVDSFEAAVEAANATEYGLSASLISVSKQEFKTFYHEVKAGVINWNQPTNGASSKLPFGGVGKSGNYRPSGYVVSDFCSYPVASVQSDLL